MYLHKSFLSFSSLLSSGTHILPHTGHSNLRLSAHLGLKIPQTKDINNSYLRVADQVLHWMEGKLFIFDDSFEHEVWHYNERNEARLILLFDFRHPDLKEDESIELPTRLDTFGNYIL